MSHLRVFRKFKGDLIKIRLWNLMMDKENIHYLCEDEIEKDVPQDNRLPLLGKLCDSRW